MPSLPSLLLLGTLGTSLAFTAPAKVHTNAMNNKCLKPHPWRGFTEIGAHTRPTEAVHLFGVQTDAPHGRWLIGHEASRDGDTMHLDIALEAIVYDCVHVVFAGALLAPIVLASLAADAKLGSAAGLMLAVVGAHTLSKWMYPSTYGPSGRGVRYMAAPQMRRELDVLGAHPRPGSAESILFAALRMHLGHADGMNECFRPPCPREDRDGRS